MAIVKMNKFTLLAFESQKAKLLEKLQGFAEVEFVNLQRDEVIENNEEFADLQKDNSGSEYAGCEEKLSTIKSTLQFLQEYVTSKSGIKALKEGKKEVTFSEIENIALNTDWNSICEKYKAKEDEILSLEHTESKLQTEIDSLTPWKELDVSFKDLNSIKIPHFLGSIPKVNEETLKSEFTEDYLEIISSNNQDLFFLLICNEDEKEEVTEKLRGIGFSQFKTDFEDVPINIIHNNLDSIEKIKADIHMIKENLAGEEKDKEIIEIVSEYYENIIIRKTASSNFLKTENISVIQGWVPEEEKDNLSSLVTEVLGENYDLTFEEVKEEEIEDVPVKLKNNEFNSAFEDITQMFSTPRYDEIDPTPLLAPFYLAFFGMMVADVGYGLLLLIGSAIVLKTFKLDEGTRKFIKFFFYLSFGIIGFGIVYGAFFGDALQRLGIELPYPYIDTNKDITTILIVAVVFGAIQIFFGLGIKAYMLIRVGKIKDAFYDVGSWVITLISAGLVLGGGALGLPEIASNIAVGTMIFGMLVIVLTNGRQAGSVGARLGQGAYALYGITSYVGDLVSYTRLMALGLAGGSLAGAFNLIAGMIPGVAAIIFVPIILIFGHIFNLALSLLGAYVHTCRLQYVEYFGKFYEGGGRSFAPFKSETKYVNLKKENK